jgi:hypothetical protein
MDFGGGRWRRVPHLDPVYEGLRLERGKISPKILR